MTFVMSCGAERAKMTQKFSDNGSYPLSSEQYHTVDQLTMSHGKTSNYMSWNLRISDSQ